MNTFNQILNAVGKSALRIKQFLYFIVIINGVPNSRLRIHPKAGQVIMAKDFMKSKGSLHMISY